MYEEKDRIYLRKSILSILCNGCLFRFQLRLATLRSYYSKPQIQSNSTEEWQQRPFFCRIHSLQMKGAIFQIDIQRSFVIWEEWNGQLKSLLLISEVATSSQFYTYIRKQNNKSCCRVTSLSFVITNDSKSVQRQKLWGLKSVNFVYDHCFCLRLFVSL